MVPDQKLSGLLSEVCRLPEKIDASPDQHFVPEINSKGLHGTLHVFSHDEALIVALLSLREQSFHQIFNRFKEADVASLDILERHKWAFAGRRVPNIVQLLADLVPQ
jgi:hypothetical protein